MPRYVRIMSASWRTVVTSSRSAGVAARRKRIRSLMRRAAAGAPFSASCCALPSVFSRKCGSTAAQQFELRLGRTGATSRSAGPPPRGAASARYSRLRRCAMDGVVTSANRNPIRRPAVTTWRGASRCPWRTRTDRRPSPAPRCWRRRAHRPMPAAAPRRCSGKCGPGTRGARTTPTGPTTAASARRGWDRIAASANVMFHGRPEASHATSVVTATDAPTSHRQLAARVEPAVERADVPRAASSDSEASTRCANAS